MYLRCILLGTVITISACSNVEEHPEPSEEAETVSLSDDLNYFKNCQEGQRLYGFGSFDTEALNDLRHQAAIKYKANAVLHIKTQIYYQNKRISNYLRTPQLRAPKATKDYYYQDAFTLRAKGITYLCPR